MNRMTVVITILVLSALACSQQISPPIPTTPTTTPVLTVETSTTVPTTADVWTVEVRLPTVNVRAEPNSKIVIGALRAGDEVALVRCVNDWCELVQGGYVYRGCLTINSGLGCTAR